MAAIPALPGSCRASNVAPAISAAASFTSPSAQLSEGSNGSCCCTAGLLVLVPSWASTAPPGTKPSADAAREPASGVSSPPSPPASRKAPLRTAAW